MAVAKVFSSISLEDGLEDGRGKKEARGRSRAGLGSVQTSEPASTCPALSR